MTALIVYISLAFITATTYGVSKNTNTINDHEVSKNMKNGILNVTFTLRLLLHINLLLFYADFDHFTGQNIFHNDHLASVPTGYPTFIYSDQDVGHSDSSDKQSNSNSHMISSPGVVSKWYQYFSNTEAPSGFPSGLPSGLPSSFPSSFPSGRPSEPPSGYPSGQPTTSPTNSTSQAPTPSPSSAPSHAFTMEPVCIELLLSDSFGDGWDDASLFVYPSHAGSPDMYSLPCGLVSKVSRYCFHPELNHDGDYVVIGVMGYQPKYSWEIKWEALNPHDNSVYEGNFDTSLTFVFNYESKAKYWVSLLSSVGVVQSSSTCKTCTIYEVTPRTTTAPKRPPQPKPPTPVVKPPPLMAKPPPKKAPGQKVETWTDLSYSMAGYNNTWFSPDGYGSDFFITSEDGVDLYYAGTLCPKWSDLGCDYHLKDGTYKWRVTGALNTYSGAVDWSFCGVDGGAMNEMTFVVKNGYCMSGDVYDLNNICWLEETSMEESVVVLNGRVNLHGVDSESTSSLQSLEILRSSLAEEFRSARPGTSLEHAVVTTLSTKDATSKGSTSHRQMLSSGMSSPVTELSFSIRIQAAKYGADGTSAEGRNQIAGNFKTYLKKSMSSGLFVTRIVASATTNKINELVSMSKAELMDLKVIHVSSQYGTRMTIISNTVVVVGSVVGVAMLVLLGLFYKAKKASSVKYSSLKNMGDEHMASVNIDICDHTERS
eukprot:gene1471-2831_t